VSQEVADTQLNLVLLGAPGAGKGTQAERIVATFGLPHISTGEILRAAVAAGTELGAQAQQHMQAGTLVPDEVVIGIIRERLAEPDAAHGFLLDGFPRTLQQAAALDDMLAAARRGLTHVVVLDVPQPELIERLSGRRACGQCGKGYHIKFDPPRQSGICDACSGELYQRADDNEATVRNRLVVYGEQTEPLIEYYSQKSLVSTISGGGRMPGDVWGDVKRVLAGAE
jgi:adenylate kinase